MKIIITCVVDSDCADSNDVTGLTEEAYTDLIDALESTVGADEIKIRKAAG